MAIESAWFSTCNDKLFGDVCNIVDAADWLRAVFRQMNLPMPM
ncbi:hypothetical protein [Methyloglobulus sp.]